MPPAAAGRWAMSHTGAVTRYEYNPAGQLDDDSFVYTGITKQTLNARLTQHPRQGKEFVDLLPQHENLTRNQARALEQYYIENGPNRQNKINSISSNNRFYDEAKQWASNYNSTGVNK